MRACVSVCGCVFQLFCTSFLMSTKADTFNKLYLFILVYLCCVLKPPECYVSRILQSNYSAGESGNYILFFYQSVSLL